MVSSSKRAALLGIPLGFGAGKIGSELGVEAMRLSPIRGRLLSERIRELGIDLDDRNDLIIQRPSRVADETENPKYLDEMLPQFKLIADEVQAILENERLPILLGGDHSIAIGTFTGIATHFKSKGDEIGLIWFDAHADINTPETSTSGNIQNSIPNTSHT